MILQNVEIYIDGASKHNPGPSGAAYVIRYWNVKDENNMPEVVDVEGKQGFRLSTNNRMEITSAINGLDKFISLYEEGTLNGAKQINLFSDSEYFVKANNMKWIDKWMQNNWMTSAYGDKKEKPVKNKDLWEKVIEVKSKIKSLGLILTITHVKGHNGNELNEKADSLAVEASNDQNQIIDEGYESTL